MTRSIAIFALLVSVTACKKQVTPEAPVNQTVRTETPAKMSLDEAVDRMAENFARVYFDFDSSTLGAESKAALDANVRIMQQHPSLTVEIQGHADERGTTDYNVALGDRRANAVRKHMILTGVSSDRVRTVSYGEEVPAIRGSNESAWSKNRRAEFRILAGQDGVAGTVD